MQPVRCVRDLGIYIESDVSMRTHIPRIMSNCASALRQLQIIRRSFNQSVLLSPVTSGTLLRQRVLCSWSPAEPSPVRAQCSCAPFLLRVEVRPRHYLLRDLHWLRVSERLHYRLAVLVFHCRQNMAPPYLARDLH